MIDTANLMAKAERLRKQLGEDQHSPVDIFALAQSIEKMTLVFYPMGDSLSGMCIKSDEGRCTIAVNSGMTLGRQRFSLAHEFYHLFFDENMRSVCGRTLRSGDEVEKKADVFASCFLMPRAAVEDKVESLLAGRGGALNVQDVIRIEQYFGVSHQAAVYQLFDCGYLDRKELNRLLNMSVRRLSERIGFRSDLYLPAPLEKQYCTYGYYLVQADRLLNKGLISNGKYEELLLDAFREDLVYGMQEGGDLID